MTAAARLEPIFEVRVQRHGDLATLWIQRDLRAGYCPVAKAILRAARRFVRASSGCGARRNATERPTVGRWPICPIRWPGTAGGCG